MSYKEFVMLNLLKKFIDLKVIIFIMIMLSLIGFCAFLYLISKIGILSAMYSVLWESFCLTLTAFACFFAFQSIERFRNCIVE